MNEFDRAAVGIVFYHASIDEIAQSIEALWAAVGDEAQISALVVGDDELHTEVRRFETAAPLGSKVNLVLRYDNLGFAGGHNLLAASSFESGCSWYLAFNPDARMEPKAFNELVIAARTHSPARSLFAPHLRRLDEDMRLTNEIDSLGIEWSRSGRHFDIGQGLSWQGRERVPSTLVQGVTGACLLISRDAHQYLVGSTGHFFDPLFIAYREDAELGIRASMAGMNSVSLDVDGFYHQRTVRGAGRGHGMADLLGVRNRFVLRWTLGVFRPGNPLLSALRDLIVLFAAATVERSSWLGVRSAWATRRFARYKSASFQTKLDSPRQR